MILKYSEAKKFLQEADILLFKHDKFPSVGWWIACYSQSEYSHVGMTHFDKEWYCLEFREFQGARKYPLEKYVQEYLGKIDVFRVCPSIRVPLIDGYAQYNFTDLTSKLITDYALNLIKQQKKYGWKIIWRICRTYIPCVRLIRRAKYNDNNGESFVCSTLITCTFRKYYLDPVSFLSDEYTKPGDIARSPIFHKLFSM